MKLCDAEIIKNSEMSIVFANEFLEKRRLTVF
jgi:hypothetical protein